MRELRLGTLAEAPRDERDVDAKLLYIAYNRLPQSLLLTFVITLAFAGLMWPFFSTARMTAWVIAILVVAAARYKLYALFQRARPESVALARWRSMFLFGSATAGAVWAFGPVLMMPQAGSAEATLFVGALLSVCAVAISTLATQKRAMQAFIIAALAPTAIASWHTGGKVEQVTALILMAGLVALLIVGRRASNAVRETLETQSRIHSILNTAMDAAIGMTAQGEITDWNLRAEIIFGWSKEEAIGLTFYNAIIPEDNQAAHRERLGQFLSTGGEQSLNGRNATTLMRRGGEEFPAELAIAPIKIGDSWHFTAFIADITDRKRAEDALRLSEERYRTIFETSLDSICINRLSDGLFIEANQSFLAIHGYPRDEVVGRSSPELNIWVDPAERQRFVELLHRDSKCSNIEARFRTKNGEVIWGLVSASVIELSDVPCFVSIRRDITERKQAEAKINRLAFYDQLTDLPNRTLLHDRLKQAMASGLRSGCHGALLLIDLDYFKTLNDTLGHDMGDLLLKQVAQRLTDCVREEDTVARQGGDEFVVMLLSLSENQSEAAALVERIGGKIIAALNQPFTLKEVSYRITSSIGASVFMGQQTDIDTLLKQADLAMYKAKDAGRNTLRFFDPDMAHDVLKRASLNNDLREALQKEQFVLHYQAQIDGGQVTGAEALLRWQHPGRGLVFPGEFILVIEETGLILPIGQWVLESACTQLADWATQPEMSHLTVAVNISARQINHENFVDQVLMALDRSGANPQRLKLELTESLLVNNVEDIIGKMTALKSKGVGFSLDDFGTGYSSLTYLKRLPLDQLKIDQSFVRDILTDPNDAAIAKMIVVLAKSMGLTVIAEGVETEAQRNSLAQQGCHAYQGYFFSRPVPLDEFGSFVKRF